MKTYAIVKDNIIQEVLYIGGGDYSAQIAASLAYLKIDGQPVEIESEMVKGEYFDKSLAPPPEPEPKPEPEPEPIDPKLLHIGKLTGYLQSTDWYITRQAETGKPAPQEVLDARQAARDEISELRQS